MEDITTRIMGLIKKVEKNALADLALTERRVSKAKAYAIELSRFCSKDDFNRDCYETIYNILDGKHDNA